MRFIGVDVHRDACQICVVEADGRERQERIPSRVDDLVRFAEGLGNEDLVAIEATGPAAAVARILEPRAGLVVVVNPRRLGQIAARAKTDRVDARTLARLLAAGVLTGVWTPDEPTRALRRLVARRAAVVRARTRQERGTRGAYTQPVRSAACHRCVWCRRSALAGEPRAVPIGVTSTGNRWRSPEAERFTGTYRRTVVGALLATLGITASRPHHQRATLRRAAQEISANRNRYRRVDVVPGEGRDTYLLVAERVRADQGSPCDAPGQSVR